MRRLISKNGDNVFQCEPDDDGDDFVVMKYGKLCFVDLAGMLWHHFLFVWNVGGTAMTYSGPFISM